MSQDTLQEHTELRMIIKFNSAYGGRMPEPSSTMFAASLRGVSVDYAGIIAVDAVDLDVAAAALTVIVGANGAGKSTVLEVLAGARAPSTGTVTISGVARAFVPQRSVVSDRLPLTVRDVVTVGVWGRLGHFRRVSRHDRAVIDDALERLGITDLASLPFFSLSGGQRQRALLAQGLARGADLLLLDEPTTGLDAGSARLIRAAIAGQVRCGVAVVCVSHDERLISDADEVIRMSRGRLVKNTHAEDLDGPPRPRPADW
ncbi:zinc ABC transporter ATP-binding protein AztA [Microbacterium sp. 1P10UB]|uniref:zinc ABC transporter ATP-binding protein AztA n=1 Tax=unclassified Microbacterium TaxID=2609290 RepID=UPI0039A26123